MYISHTSPPEVAKAYYKQFQGDFSKFLKARSMEIACGGKMVLAMLGRRTTDHSDPSTSLLWELLAQSFDLLVSHVSINICKRIVLNILICKRMSKIVEC